MGHSWNDSRQRGAWTPFVGVALATLTAGSLVVFSLVAQRTSLAGYALRGVAAITPSAGTPSAITFPSGAAATAPAGDATLSAGDGPATFPLTLSPASALLGSDDSSAPQAAVAVAVAPAAGTDVVAASDRRVSPAGDGRYARFSPDGGRAAPFRDGETDHDAEGTGKAKHPEKAKKAKKAKHTKKNKKSKKAHHRKKPSSSKGGAHEPAATHQGSSDNARQGHASNNSNQKASKPQKASKSSAGHSTTKGKGHSKGHRRGHTDD